MMLDLNPNVKYRGNKEVLQNMARELYKYVPPLNIKLGNTLAANIILSEIVFGQYTRDSGNFIPIDAEAVRSIFVDVEGEKSGKLTGKFSINNKTRNNIVFNEPRERGIEDILFQESSGKGDKDMKADISKYEKYFVNIEDAAKQGLLRIDIGGSPANVLRSNKINYAIDQKAKPEQLVMILDPFDLSREERMLLFGNYKVRALKFEVDSNTCSKSAESCAAPDVYIITTGMDKAKPNILGTLINKYSAKLNAELKAYANMPYDPTAPKITRELTKQRLNEFSNTISCRYENLKNEIIKLADTSKNLRVFMNDLLTILLPLPVKTILLEDVLSKNTKIVYDLLEKVGDINVRAICPQCNEFVQTTLKSETSCCGVSADEIIKSGKYIPEDGFFPVLTTLCGYVPAVSPNSKYIEPATKILEQLGIKPQFVIIEKPADNKTMFESYLLRGYEL